MPKYDDSRLKNRAVVDRGDIYRSNRHPDLDVIARPTDPYEQQATDAETAGIVESLKAFSGGVNSYVTLQNSQRDRNTLQGKTDAAKNVHNPPSNPLNLGVGYDEAWDELSAQKYAAEEYGPAVNQYLADSSHLPPEEFRAGLKALNAQYMGKMKSSHQVAGFFPEAEALNQQAVKANFAKYTATKQLERDSLIASNSRIGIEGSLQVSLGVNSLEQLFDPEVYKGILNAKDTPEGVSKMNALTNTLYGMYRNGLASAKVLGKTTAEYSAQFLQTVSGVAIKYGMPELLQYAFKSYIPTAEEMAAGRKPDNITVADAFQEHVEKDMREATAQQYRMKEAIERQEAKALKDAQHKLARDTNDSLFDLLRGNDPQKAQKALVIQTQYRARADELKMEPEASKYVNSMVDSIDQTKLFAHASDDKTMVRLYAKGMNLTHSDVLAARRQLEEKDFTKLMDRAWNYEKAQMDRSNDESKYMLHKALDNQQREIEDFYTVRNPVSGILSPESEEAKGRAIGMIGRYYQEHPKADAKALREYWQSVIMKAIPKPPNIYLDAMNLTPVNPAQAILPPPPPAPMSKSKKEPLKTGKTKSGIEFHVE